MSTQARAAVGIGLILALAVSVVPSAFAVRAREHEGRGGPPSGMKLVFADDFPGSSLDTAKWDTCYPWADTSTGCTNFGNPELEWMLPAQDQVAGNVLHLVSAETPTQGTTSSGVPRTYSFRSGMISSYRSFAFQYGYVSVRARPPSGEGLWTAFWLLPTSQKWPPEIDIAEFFGDDPSTVHVVYHPASRSQHVGNVHVGNQSRGWHTYALDWEPNSITWFVDGRQIYHYSGRTPSERMYFLSDLAVAYLFGAKRKLGPPALASLDIANVEVYQR